MERRKEVKGSDLVEGASVVLRVKVDTLGWRHASHRHNGLWHANSTEEHNETK
jgi:hypothetical protein